MLKTIFKNLIGSSDKQYSYEEAKDALEKKKNPDKIALAENKNTKPEILYYLASDKSVKIRRKIATNTNTPIQADSILAEDKDTEVRQELARKISRMLPDLADNEITMIRERAIKILETLANDQLPGVRRILSEELKTFDCVPKHIIMRLAEDSDLNVCAPILEYSPLLSTEDLKEIIAITTVDGALKAIAKRAYVDEEVSDAISSSLDIPAVATLLANKNAQIRESTLDAIINQATEIEELHHPLATRPNLSIRAIKRIASFVASALVNHMITSYNLDQDMAKEILERVQLRIKKNKEEDEDSDTLAKHAQDFYNQGLLDDTFIENTINNRQRELLFHCLSQMSKMPIESVRKIFTSKKARRVVALAWRCELSMRTALKMQQEIGCILTSQVLHAKGGCDYPLSKAEMEYDLALYDGGNN
ncbi:MAG: DUF2336 domain-containing protein [Emcibacter sp.]|nr:DUF2336 domain-containing protein [Emcibacter sp.]